MEIGVEPLIYHGELNGKEKEQNQKDFIDGKYPFIIATNAFGMGINKKDIRYIIHWEIPGSLESYYQEIGRAGRDNKISYCCLLHNSDDIYIQKEFLQNSNPSAEYLTLIQSEIKKSKNGINKKEIREKYRSGVWDHRFESALNILEQQDKIFRKVHTLSINHNNISQIDPQYIKAKHQSAINKLGAINKYAESDKCYNDKISSYFLSAEYTQGCNSCSNCERKTTDSLYQKIEECNDQLTINIAIQRNEKASSSSSRYVENEWIKLNKIGIAQIKEVKRNGEILIIERADNFSTLKINSSEFKITKIR